MSAGEGNYWQRHAGLATTLLFAAAIVIGSTLGWFAPAIGQHASGAVDTTILWLVGLLIFEVRLTRCRLRRAELRVLALTWIANFVLIPALGFAIASLFLSGQPLFRTGLIIYFMAPCTDWFLGFTRLARGNTALGAMLLPLNMASQLLLYPLFIAIYAGAAAPVDPATMGDTLLNWFVWPFVVAVALRLLADRALPRSWHRRLMHGLERVIPLLIALLIVEIFAAHIGTLVEHADVFATVLFAVFAFFVATFILGEVTARVGRLAYADHALLAMTTAARNAPMMLGVTALAMPDQPLVYAAIIIGMLVEFPHLTALRHILLKTGTVEGAPVAEARVPSPRSAS